MNNLVLEFNGVSCLGCVKAIEHRITKFNDVEITDISQNNGDTIISTRLSASDVIEELNPFDGCCDACQITLSTIKELPADKTNLEFTNEKNEFQLVKKQYQIALQKAIEGIEVACSEFCVCKTTDFDRLRDPNGVPSFASVFDFPDHLNSIIQKGMNIIDFGSGTGHDALKIAQTFRNIQINCVDVTPEMVNYGREKAKDLKLNNVKFIEGSNLDGFANESQDLVYTNNVFNLLPSKSDFIHDVFRVLKKGGLLIIADEYSKTSLPIEIENDPKFQCGGISGAKSKTQIIDLCLNEGFVDSTFKIINQYEIDYAKIKYALETGILMVKKKIRN